MRPLPTSRPKRPQRTRGPAPAPRGVVLLYTLIALVVMLIAGVALVRSFNNSMFNAGNIAFKRDLVNQGERARAAAADLLSAGALANAAARNASSVAVNYSATMLPSNAQGLPTALLDDGAFAAVGAAANDISPTDPDGNDLQVRVRYLIDRQCSANGAPTPETCVLTGEPPPLCEAPCDQTLQPALNGVVYRLSVRVDGPRNTQTFLQSTFAL